MRKGAREVIMQDKRDAAELGDDLVLELVREGVRAEFGDHREQTLLESDLVVVSPGVPKLAVIERTASAGVLVVSEIEFASWFIEADIVAITGTNGKSTVTSLIGSIIEHSGVPSFVGGNLGPPLSDAVDSIACREGGVVVLELSSYQLERTLSLAPKVAVMLNLTPDHLDRYGTLGAYGAAKQRIFRNQKSSDFAVVPGFDAMMIAMARAGAAKVETYGTADSSVRAEGGDLVDRWGANYSRDSIKIRGGHNLENAMAAVLATRLLGVGETAIREGLTAFAGLPHRMEFVADDDNIEYFNDSKATNVAAAVKAIVGLGDDRKIVLIAGGRDKGGSYEPLRALIEQRGRAVVLLGESTELMKAQFEDIVAIRVADDMFDAVSIARGCARSGDVVLLAPACSSLDMFENFEERGRIFSAAVRALAGTSRQEEDLSR